MSIRDRIFIGYEILSIGNPEVSANSGLREGDILIKVNNILLNSKKNGIRVLRNIVKVKNFDLVVLRNEVEIPFYFSILR